MSKQKPKAKPASRSEVHDILPMRPTSSPAVVPMEAVTASVALPPAIVQPAYVPRCQVSEEQPNVRLPEPTQYPRAFPMHALESLQKLAQRRDWKQDKALLGHAVWELIGATHRILFGDPLNTRIEASAVEPRQLADNLFRTREYLFAWLSHLQNTRVATTQPAGVDALLAEERFAVERLLENAISYLASLRKIALDSATRD